MIGIRLGGARDGLPLGQDEAARFLPLIIALMVYVAALGGVGLIALGDALRAADRALAASLTLQVAADASRARMETVLALLRQTKGVVSVDLLDPKTTARLLEPWLGPKVPLDELPVPRLVELRIDPAAPPDLDKLRQQLASVVPEAELDDHRPGLATERAAIRRIEGILAVVVAAALGLVAVTTVFAVRAALRAQQPVVELAHLLGAADRDIARRFALGSLVQGLLGGALGGGAVLLTAAALAGIPGAPATGDWRVWGVVVGAALAAGLIAAAGVWRAVLRWLAPMP